MDMTQIGTTLGAAVTQIEAQSGGNLPQYVPTTAKGKIGYDHIVDAMNRLPRPAMAFLTLGIFVVAGFDPVWFDARMQALAAVPQPMWWIIGAVITFFFGARETHYLRTATPPKA